MAEEQTTKLCTKCNRILPATEFCKDRQKSDGLSSACRECRTTSTYRWRSQNIEHASAMQKLWEQNNKAHRRAYQNDWRSDNRERCRAQANDRRARDPERHRAVDRARYARNKMQIRVVQRAWRHAHPEYGRKNNRLFYLRHKLEFIARYIKPYRARKSGAEGFWTVANIEAIAKMQRFRCAYCRKKIARDNWHVDHITPLIKGGSNWPSNLQLCCQRCNSSKGGDDPLDYARKIGRLL